MFVFAHLSDTHFGHPHSDDGQAGHRDRARERTRRGMSYLRGLPLDAILVTGDIADHGTEDEYEQARAELVADVPVLCLPGNHDRRAEYRKVMLDLDGEAPVNAARLIDGVLFLLCDSSIPGRNDGQLAPETLAWLRAELARTPAPTFICLHHPPVVLHHALLDSIRLGQPEELAELVEAHPQVVAVLCGHAHSAAASTFGGRPLVVAPGVVSTIRLPFTAAEELTWANAPDYDDEPAVAFHVFAEGRLTTHFRMVPAG